MTRPTHDQAQRYGLPFQGPLPAAPQPPKAPKTVETSASRSGQHADRLIQDRR